MLIAAGAGDALGSPEHAWIFEGLGGIAFVAVLAYHVRATVRTRQLSIAALAFIGCLTMAWQEYYGDWGAYLLYNKHFALLPWGHSVWTTPNKPWAAVAGYGWFYSALFPAMLWILARVRSARPDWSRATAAAVVAAPALYVWNFVSAEGLAARFGWWRYVKTTGPTLHEAKGDFPLLYPVVFFLLFAVVALWLIDDRDDTGRPRFERLARASGQPRGAGREARRAGAWILVMNATYLVTLIAPLMALRFAFGDPSNLVP